MSSTNLRVALLTLVLAASSFAVADQKIKTKSNIKNDRLAESSSASACVDVKEGSADGKTPCKAVDASGAASSVAHKDADKIKPQ